MPRLDARHGIAALLCVTAAIARIVVGPHITDDAYITMRYSNNLSAAGTMSYNPPDAVLGTSTPLWTWILAAGNVAGIAPGITAVVTAAIADMTSIALIVVSPIGLSLPAVGAAATIAAWPAYVTYSVSGMETSLYVLSVVAFAAALSRRRAALAAAAASAGALCRPDGALLVVLGCAWLLAVESKKAALQFVTIAALICAPWTVYAIARFGSLIPASVSAKAAATDAWLTSLKTLQAYFLHGVYLPLTLLALAGFVASSVSAFWRIWSVWAWSYLAAMTAMNAFTHFPWYLVPLLPIYVASATDALERVVSLAQGNGWRFPRAIPAGREAAAIPTFAALCAAVLLSRMLPLKGYLDAAAAGRETLYASVATELAGRDPHCTVAATEIGTIGFHYPGRVLDLVGLVSPEVVGRPVNDVLAESNTRWLVTYDTHFDRAVAASAPFSALFVRRSTVPVGDARNLEIYERRNGAVCGTP